MKKWDEEDYQQALLNYERMLKERPGDAELLRNYQVISLEYERYKKDFCKQTKDFLVSHLLAVQG